MYKRRYIKVLRSRRKEVISRRYSNGDIDRKAPGSQYYAFVCTYIYIPAHETTDDTAQKEQLQTSVRWKRLETVIFYTYSFLLIICTYKTALEVII